MYHKIATLCWKNIKEIVPDVFVPKYLDSIMLFAKNAICEQNIIYQNEKDKIINVMKESGIGCVPVKGNVFIKDLYGIDGTRFQGDMDFLIKYDDINQVNEIIRECGYIQGTYDDKAKEIIPVSRTEEIKWKMFMSNLFPYRKAVENKNVPVIKVDFRFKLTDTKDKEPVNEIVNNYIQKGYADNCYLLLHLCTHFYGESKQTISIYSAKDMNLIKLCDIREFVLQKCNQDDLKKTINYADKWKLNKEVFYTMYILKQIYNDGYEEQFIKNMKVDAEEVLNSYGESTNNESKYFNKDYIERIFGCDNISELERKPIFLKEVKDN